MLQCGISILNDSWISLNLKPINTDETAHNNKAASKFQSHSLLKLGQVQNLSLI